MQVDAIDLGRARRGADVAAVRGEQPLEVVALDVVHPALSHRAQRLRDIDRRLRIDGIEPLDRLPREAALDVVAQLAHVARPRVAQQLGQ